MKMRSLFTTLPPVLRYRIGFKRFQRWVPTTAVTTTTTTTKTTRWVSTTTSSSAIIVVFVIVSSSYLFELNNDEMDKVYNDIDSASDNNSSRFDDKIDWNASQIRNWICSRIPTSYRHSFSSWLDRLGLQPRLLQHTYCENSHEQSSHLLDKVLGTGSQVEQNKKTDTADTGSHSVIDHDSTDSTCSDDDSFPNLIRHGKNSILRNVLTRSMYNELKTRTTSYGTTIEDIIRAGVCLPYGVNPPQNVITTTVTGVYAGDPESYTIFAPLFDPIIEHHHHATSRVRLQRFRTNLNPGQLIQHRLDPTGEYILYTRMRLARSIIGFRFTPCMTRVERRTVERLIRDCVNDIESMKKNESNNDNDTNSTSSTHTNIHPTSNMNDGGYKSIMEMSNKEHDDLVRRQLLYSDPDEYMISAGLARDWPDGRGIYCDTWIGTPNVIIWCNAADHVWIIINAKGGDVQGVFKRMSKAVWTLETSLKQRGYGFVEDRRLGYLNASPKDIGTALRASVYIKLVRLGQHKGFHRLIKRLHLEARAEQYSQATTDMKRYTGIFDIGNAEALGKTEVQLINIMIHGVAICIDLERRLQNGEVLDLDAMEFPLPIQDSTPPLFLAK